MRSRPQSLSVPATAFPAVCPASNDQKERVFLSILDRFSLKGRIALVTVGAGPLFGSSISEALAEAGATVISASRSLERNQTFALSMQQKGLDVLGLELDITQTESIERLHDQVLGKIGRLDILVNSALVEIWGEF